jgi:hypothetical protein
VTFAPPGNRAKPITAEAKSHVDLFDQVDGEDHAALMSLGIALEPFS